MVYIHNIDPVLLHLGSLEIRYYGLVYILGLVLGYFIIRYLAKQKKLSLTDEDLVDFILYMGVGLLLGGRLFYTLVYNISYYLSNPLHIFALWEGGMSFHGGMLGAIIAGYVYCKKKNVSFYKLADITMIPLAFGLMFGRIANFINAELYGRLWHGPWADNFGVDFGDGFARYPSQLFESFKNLVIFIILWFWNKDDVGIGEKDIITKHNIKHNKRPDGVIFWGFIMLYGLFRFFIEFYRQPDSQVGVQGFFFGWMTMGQILTIPMFLFGLGMVVWLYKQK